MRARFYCISGLRDSVVKNLRYFQHEYSESDFKFSVGNVLTSLIFVC